MSDDYQPTTITTITTIHYSVLEFVAGTSITMRVLLLDQNGNPVEYKNVTLDGIYYKQWSIDDSFLLNWLTSNLGLIINETPVLTNPSLAVVEAPLLYTNLYTDNNGDIVLQDGFSRNQFNIIVDQTNMPVKFAILRYWSNGLPDLSTQLMVGPDDNPILPTLYIRSDSGYIMTKTGEFIVIIYSKN
jgi:hypothetical protein